MKKSELEKRIKELELENQFLKGRLQELENDRWDRYIPYPVPTEPYKPVPYHPWSEPYVIWCNSKQNYA